MVEKMNVTYLCDKNVYLWNEQDSSIMLKAITKHGDPVEMTANENRERNRVIQISGSNFFRAGAPFIGLMPTVK
jgi:hypothetical protein